MADTLYREIISGNPYVNYGTSGIFRVRIADSPPVDFEEANTIADIHRVFINEYELVSRGDYKRLRDMIKQIVVDAGSGDENVGFDTLTADEKLICCNYLIGSESQRAAIVGLDNAISLDLAYHAQMVTGVRNVRLSYAIASVNHHIQTTSEQHEIKQRVIGETPNLAFNYVLLGVGSLIDDGVDGIVDYIYGASGSKFSGTGLLQQSYTVTDIASISDLCDKLNGILMLGVY